MDNHVINYIFFWHELLLYFGSDWDATVFEQWDWGLLWYKCIITSDGILMYLFFYHCTALLVQSIIGPMNISKLFESG